MRATVFRKIALAVTLLVVSCPTGAYGGATLCGYVLDIVCPGCTATNPGGCACLPEEGACNCKPADNKVVCLTNDFSYTCNPNGYELEVGDSADCSWVEKCMMENGGTNGCGTYKLGLCQQPPPPDQPCRWRLFGNVNQQPLWTQGDPC
jgi:hypothetical protein